MHALAVGGFQVSKVLLYVLDVLSPIHYITVSIFFFQFVSITDGDIFRLDKLHWFLAVVFMQEKKVVIYDSLPAEDGRVDYLTDIFQYLKDEHKHKHGLDLPNVDNWTTVPCPKGNAIAPLQGPTNDCGVFFVSIHGSHTVELPCHGIVTRQYSGIWQSLALRIYS